MATTDTDVSQLVINKLTKQQYDAIATKSPTELYAVTDIPAVDVMTGATAGAAGTSGTVPAPAAGDQDKVLSGAGTWVAQSGGTTYTAGNHIDITSDVISAIDYIHADTPTPATTPTGTITSGMIADGTITAADIATGVVPTITLSTTDIGEGAPLAANTLYGVYE